MQWWEAVLLGALQGMTEFLPISSSAHLRIFGPLLPSGGDPGAAFTAIVQLGTEAAVLLYFRGDIWRIARAWLAALVQPRRRSDPEARMGWFIILGTLPIVLLGLLFKDAIETYLRNLYLVASMLILFGIVLAVADAVGRQTRQLTAMRWPHALAFGFAQAAALIPGVSRSGGTISGGLLMGFTREAAARYSFLLAIPAVLASGLYQLVKSWGLASAVPWQATLLATAVAFVTGYALIVFFMRWITRHSYLPFVIYRIALGMATFALLGTGRLTPL
ncbi:hypothetical protein AAV94_04830 [Lampropedia cohaerens]|uniref:Undecaprenyl-diphosphatase n=1 Tax=Lampropedia cohaerens TaxID=1610491 RepID=A0A0U1Q0Y9_9BURK|nr:undecaprenyl-diphosphate phosphatase [Lampropedia cohaerens]KKW68434.1 hypothetical protein AAV94_04830 [Lampropedia cohaerens]